MQNRLWQIKEYPFKPDQHLYYETIFAIGNGYLGTRASFEEGWGEDTPATFVHGIFNHASEMTVPELVNIPNWLPIRIMIDDTLFRMNPPKGDLLQPKGGALLGYRRTLHMDTATLRREVLFRAESGSTVKIVFERFASLADVHVLAQRVTITAIDGEPEITIDVSIDGDVTNNGIHHWENLIPNAENGVVTLEGITNQSGYKIGLASTLVASQHVTATTADKVGKLSTKLSLDKFGTATFDKLTTIYTSRDTTDVIKSADTKVREVRSIGYDELYKAHSTKWADVWDQSDIQIEGDETAQIYSRFTAYHVLIAAPQHDNDVSIGAKTLSGFGYKGHIFWDTELFALPPLTLTHPKIARNLLTYRFKRLNGARKKAQEYGFSGAMFPWESTDTGEETTPKWSDPQHDGTRIRIWTGETEQHISTDIAYAILQYWRWTGDDEFLCDMGAEIVLDTAVFWCDRVELKNDRYELSKQIGPDEYHENIDNSVFTNRMVQWHLQQALDLYTWLQTNSPEDSTRLTESLNITDERLDKWRDIIEKMYIPFDEERQIHIQFDGFFDMEYIPVLNYEPRVGGIWSFLGHERALQSQVIKQADVVMLMALLGDEVGSHQVMVNNFNTYYPRTDHGSSLSPAVHAWVAARLGLEDIAYYMFEHAGAIDLEDNKGNVRDGIHAAASGGLWQAILFGFCGLYLTEDGPAVDPKLPSHWKQVSFKVNYRGKTHSFVVKNPA